MLIFNHGVSNEPDENWNSCGSPRGRDPERTVSRAVGRPPASRDGSRPARETARAAQGGSMELVTAAPALAGAGQRSPLKTSGLSRSGLVARRPPPAESQPSAGGSGCVSPGDDPRTPAGRRPHSFVTGPFACVSPGDDPRTPAGRRPHSFVTQSVQQICALGCY